MRVGRPTDTGRYQPRSCARISRSFLRDSSYYGIGGGLSPNLRGQFVRLDEALACALRPGGEGWLFDLCRPFTE